mgnify:CR=1 FL=1
MKQDTSGDIKDKTETDDTHGGKDKCLNIHKDLLRAIDLTVKAVDKNNVIVNDYDWVVVIFSESDPEAELPSALDNNTYEFLSSDQWEVKFENAVIFRNAWLQDLYVYDLDDDTVMWIWEVNVSKVEVLENVEIEIVSPESWTTIWEKNIDISGFSTKNHNINIIVNGEDSFTTTTNEEGVFEYNVTWLADWENIMQVEIINADWEVIWESNEVSIDVNFNEPGLKSIKIDPEEVEIENSFKIEILTNNITTSASIILNEEAIELDKEEEWLFSKYIYAPSIKGNYSIDVTLQDELGHEITELGVSNIIVNEPELNVSQEEVTVDTNNEESTEEVDLTVKWIKVIELKSKSIISWDKVEWAVWYNVYKKLEDGSYELMAEVNEEKYEIEFGSDEVKYDWFAIKAIAEDDEWMTFEWDLSEATKVKTWPEMLILLLISLFVWGLFIFTKNKKDA